MPINVQANSFIYLNGGVDHLIDYGLSALF